MSDIAKAIEQMPTPETDAAEAEPDDFRGQVWFWVEANFARSLEQRLAYALPYMQHKPTCRLMDRIPKWHDFKRGPGYIGGCTCGLDVFLTHLKGNVDG